MKNFISFIWETIKIVIIALIIVIPIRYFLFQPIIVDGSSMEPNYNHGDYLIIDGISYRFRDPERGEVVVFRYPEDTSIMHIKRIIGMPEETIVIDSQGIKAINSEGNEIVLDESQYLSFFNAGKEFEVVLEENSYFVLGDNRAASFDSRRWGSLPREYIVGKTVLRVFPFYDFGISKTPEY